MSRVLVTGATGFIGRVLCAELARAGYTVRAALRAAQTVPREIAEQTVVGEVDGDTRWDAALIGVESVVHAAARTHVLRRSVADRDLYMRTNAEGTRGLAVAAAASGVRRFVYLSSIKVNGEETAGGAYTALDVPNPRDDYGRSKLQAEQILAQVSAGTGMSVAIVRPPLVYGPGVRANFLRLMSWVDRERSMPFGAVHNRRSFVNVWNLTDLLVRLLGHGESRGNIWMVSDAEDLSTAELIRRLASALQRRPRLLPVPPGLLRLCGRLTGTSPQIARLCGSLTVDCTETQKQLGWVPPVAMSEALARTASWYRAVGR